MCVLWARKANFYTLRNTFENLKYNTKIAIKETRLKVRKQNRNTFKTTLLVYEVI